MALAHPRKHWKKPSGRRPTKRKVPIDHSPLYPYLSRYLEWLEVKGFSAITAHRRDSALRRFIAWCDERDLSDPREVTKPILERYQRHLFYYRQENGEALAFSTQHQLMVCVKSWFKWLTQENYILSNPASEVLPVKQPKRLPEGVLSVDEVRRILNSVDTDSVEGVRNRAMLEMFYSTGIRRTELCRLLVTDVHVDRASVYVREGKGAKDRYVPIGQGALLWVRKYLEEARPELEMKCSDHLFLSRYGDGLSSSYVGHVVRKLLDAAGIDREGGCHLFRHAMATHMLENGAELRYIQAMLGHSSINTTTMYTHIALDQLRWVHEQSHPGSGISEESASGCES